MQNSNTTQGDDEARGPQRTVRVVWPIPTTEVSTEVTEISAPAKNESVKTAGAEADTRTISEKEGHLHLPERAIEPIPTPEVREATEIGALVKGESIKTAGPAADPPTTDGKENPFQLAESIPPYEVSTDIMEISALAKSERSKTTGPEADPATTGDKESPVQPPEQTIKPLRTMPLALLIFLSFGLPAASVLAWVVMKADGARGEQIVRRYLDLNEAKNVIHNNKRLEPDWIEKLLEQIQSAKQVYGIRRMRL